MDQRLTIPVLYSCPACGLKDVEVQVTARRDEDVMEWFEQTMIVELGTDHHQRSPLCRPDRLHDIKIPTTGRDRIGGALAN